MTLEDKIAIEAMKEIMRWGRFQAPSDVAIDAYKIARAMCKERSK
jgi:hypothetical protein